RRRRAPGAECGAAMLPRAKQAAAARTTAAAPRRHYSVPLRDRTLALGERPLVMGVLNVTPDSFAGGITDPAAACDAAVRMEAEGADLIDIGGESTRPGADPIDADEELRRGVAARPPA